MSHIATKAALGLATALLLGRSAVAAGPDPSERVVVLVKATDTELHTLQGAKALALRIRNAAAEACGRSTYPTAVIFSDGFRHCRETAIDRAIKEFDSTLLADALGRPPTVLARSGR